MGWLKKILGVSALERKLEKLEGIVENLVEAVETGQSPAENLSKSEKELLTVLEGRMTTDAIAEKLKKSRSWVSSLLNDLERDGKVKETGKEGKTILYEVV